MAGRQPGSKNGTRTCPRCRQAFQTTPAEAGVKLCPSCRATDRRRRLRPADDPGQALPAADDADYPGSEWAPLPPALLIKIAAHVLAREYVAWASQRQNQ